VATRRQFLKTSAAGASLSAISPAAPLVSGAVKRPVFGLGIATYSLRALSRARAIEVIRSIGARYAAVKSFHLEYADPVPALEAGAKEFRDAGIQIVGGGVVPMKETDDIRERFEYAHVCGMPLMTIDPDPPMLPTIEAMVREYDIAVAIHNHGPESEFFPSPYEVLEYVDSLDARIGVCMDVGHTTRCGVDIIQAARDTGSRLLDVHLKDLRDLRDGSTQCRVGRGSMPLADLFHQLAEMEYAGYANLEFEIDELGPEPGMAESFAYMRGIRDGLMVTEE
jgi:sugar phosphate isomerase/epimerase